MEKLKAKHDHKLTDIIKVCIFGIFLLFPIMLFSPSILYYAFNEHATDPEITNIDINYKYKSNEVNNISDLVKGNIYNFKLSGMYPEDIFNGTGKLSIILLNDIEMDSNASINDYDNYFFRFIPSQTMIDIIFDTTDNKDYLQIYQTISDFENGDYSYKLLVNDVFYNDIIGIYFSQSNLDYTIVEYTNYNIIEDVEIITSSDMPSKIQLEWRRTWSQPCLNWTNNNNFNFTIKTFTSVFNVDELSCIPQYLTYILTITTIYIIFDIILTMFTWLTHLIGQK